MLLLSSKFAHLEDINSKIIICTIVLAYKKRNLIKNGLSLYVFRFGWKWEGNSHRIYGGKKILVRALQKIEFIVNNAGLGINKPFHTSSLAEEINLLNVLVKAPLEICHTAIKQMKRNKKGFIVNVGSMAAWTTSGTYSAAKVWLTSFSESLNTNYRDSGINVTVVAPGFTKTEFHQRANMSIATIPNWMWMTTNLVVKDSLEAVFKGQAVVIPHLKYKLLYLILRILPRNIVRKFSNSYQSRRQ